MRKRIVYLIFAIFLGLFNNVTAITSMAGNKPLLPLHVDGKWLVNSDGKKVVLHGVMDTPNMYFNNNRWTGGYTESGASNCLTFFEKLYDGLEQANCDVFRLHLDPVWTNDYNKTSDGKESGEADISRFSSVRLQSFLTSLFIPLMEKAMNHGMYVVVRPPGICPTNLQVGDYYQDYLLTVWDIVSKNATIKGYSGQISFELANEPVNLKDANGNNNTTASHDYFQPIVNKIRENGFDGIIWVPGIGWQTDCKDYSTYPITGTNIGYAVHDYPGYYGYSDSNADAQKQINAFQTSVPMVTSAPILISEVDWSPENPNSAGHYNESGQLVKDNYGTWGTATTSKWGNAFKAMLDHFGNISMTLSGSYCLIDLDELFDNNKVTAAFDGNMEACGGACMKWYADYAQDNNTSEDIITFADANVKAICIANWDTDGDGELSYDEAAAVLTLSSAFRNNTSISAFDELQYFTGLKSTPSAFYGCTGLSAITLPSHLTNIGTSAFNNCSSLATVNIPNNVSNIGDNAFKGCSSLTAINIPNSVTAISDGAFQYCTNVASLIIPEGVTQIASGAFFNCTGLITVSIPNSLTSVGSSAFGKCNSLISVTSSITKPAAIANSTFRDINSSCVLYVPAGTKSLYEQTNGWHENFSQIVEMDAPSQVITFTDTNVKAICVANWDTDGDGELNTKEAAAVKDIGQVFKDNGSIRSFNEFQYFTGLTRIEDGNFQNCSNLTSIIIPNGVTSIGHEVFTGCSNLESITLPETLKELGFPVFRWNHRLKSIVIPKSVTSCSYAIWGCDGLESLVVNEGNPVYDSRNNCNAIIETATNTLVNGCKATVIPEGVETIETHAFCEHTALKSITIPSSVKKICGRAFWTTSLTDLVIPEGVEEIENEAFGCNGALTSVSLPTSLKKVSSDSFDKTNLRTLVVAEGNSIYDSRANCNAIIETASNTLIIGCNTTVIPNTVTGIGEGAFSGCGSLTSVNIPSGVTRIGSGAFAGCSNLTSVTSNIMTPFTLSDDVFEGINESCILYVPIGTQSLYEQTEGWNEHFSKILEKPLTIFATNMSREYGEANPTWAFTSTGGVPNGTPTFSCEATETSPVGTYDIIVSQGSVTNTNVTYVKGKLTITKAPLKVTVKDCSKYEEEENPTFELIYSGFKNGETEEVVTQKPTAMCTADADSKVGTYIITVSGGEAPNYTLNYESGTLTVKEPPMDLFEVDNMTFQLARQSPEKGVAFVKAPETSEFTVPMTTTYNGATCPVTAIADEAFANWQQLKSVTIPASITKKVGKNLFSNCPHLASIVWETPCELTNETLGKITNPNLLLYVTNVSSAPEGITNVINLQTKRSEHIVLTDEDETNDFYCPVEFMAGEITYMHTFNQRTQTGACRGWETLVLPFDVTDITHEANGVITPFGALDRGYEYVNNTRPFWLYQYSSKGFMEAEGVRANIPYLISMPNEARLGREYIQKGKVTFKATNATVKATSTAKAVKSGNCSFTPNYQQAEMPTAYLLNVGEVYDVHPEGSIFVKNHRSARPFEAYFEVEGSAGVKPYFGVFEHLTDGVRPIVPTSDHGNAEYYQLDGTKRTSPQRGFNIVRTKNGEVHKALIK